MNNTEGGKGEKINSKGVSVDRHFKSKKNIKFGGKKGGDMNKSKGASNIDAALMESTSYRKQNG